MTIAVFGEDLFTLTVIQSLLEKGHAITLIVCPLYKREKNYKDIQKTAVKNSIDFIITADINSDLIREELIAKNTELIISVHLRKILQKNIFSAIKYGALNVHPSLLPKYRGLTPLNQAVINGDTETGVTIHFIDEGVDTGDIVIREKITIDSKDYISDLQLKVLKVYKYLVPKAVEKICEKDFIAIVQDKSDIGFYGNIRKKDREVDFKGSTQKAYNLIRAVSMPYSGAVCGNNIVWAAYFPEKDLAGQLEKQFPVTGCFLFPDKDELMLRFNDGIIFSDDFETIN